ncbi:MAG: SH3 domain-containing protein [Acidobacteriota bacterium]
MELADELGVGLIGLVLALLLLAGCGKQEQKVLGYAYTGPASLNLRSDLGLRASTTATVEHGERLQILEAKRRFVRVRTTQGAEGWTDSTLLLTQVQMDQLQNLAQRAKESPSQAVGSVFDTLNLHTGAQREAPSFAQIQENEKIDVVARRVTPREGLSPDDWFLVRDNKGHAGWVLSRGVLMLVPDEVAQYASGAFIMGYMQFGGNAESRNR